MQNDRIDGWRFSSPTETRFGNGCRASVLDLVRGKRILIVTSARGKRQFLADTVLSGVDADVVWVDDVKQNPGLDDLRRQIKTLDAQVFDAVVAFGGGSAIDAAKALAAVSGSHPDECDIGTLISEPGRMAGRSVPPIYALTTTSGTGAEVTPFATIWDHANRKKLSLTSPALYPTAAFVDPELTYGLPMSATLSTGLDALNQAFESVWNRNRSPITTLMAARAIGLGLEALPRLHHNLADADARSLIAEASLLAGLCISQTRTAICHSVSYPLTAHFGLPHGFACGLTMSAVAHLVHDHPSGGMQQVSSILGYRSAQQLAEKLDDVLQTIDLRAIVDEHLPNEGEVIALVDEMHTPGRADNFIVTPSKSLIISLLQKSL